MLENLMYRLAEDLYELIKKFQFKGAVEAMALAQVLLYTELHYFCISLQDSNVLVVGVRGDNLLHCIEFSNEAPHEVRHFVSTSVG